MPSRIAPTLLLVTPYLADANNGNWRTAARWARLLEPAYRPILQAANAPVEGGRGEAAVAMIALHARRSRDAIRQWRSLHPDRALVVALTGTDLYRDLPNGDVAALCSLEDAHRLVVLQVDALAHLPPAARAKADVIHQSAHALVPFAHKSAHRLNCVFVGHLRDEKDPSTLFDAWRLLDPALPVTLTIIGAALDATLGEAARTLAAGDPRVQVLGARPHAWTRQAIKRAHLLIVPSRMEGGANVVVEAVTAGTPVLGSRMSGNVGMLGDDYPGLFGVGDPAALAASIERAHRDRGWLSQLVDHCRERAPLFTPSAERAALLATVQRACTDAAGRMARSPSPCLQP